MLRNITLLGIHGRPIIKAERPCQPNYLFEERGLQKVKVFTLKIKDLIFRAMGVAHVANVTSNRTLLFQNCYFENTVASRDIIRIGNHSSELYNGIVHFHHCHFTNNVALESNGAISVNQIHSVFHECYFNDNFSTGKGLIVLAGGIIVIKESHFEKNSLVYKYTVGMMGGAIYATANSNIQILNSVFKRNKALELEVLYA